MSNLQTLTQMATECATRVPIGLSSAFWVKKLNEAYRWISQKGNYVWDIKVSLTTQVTLLDPYGFTLPSDCDPGKPMYLSGPQSGALAQTGNMYTLIPFKPWDDSLEQQFAEVVAPPGMYSCWSYYANFSYTPSFPTAPTYAYKAILYPTSAKPTVTTGAFTFIFAYHTDVNSTEYTGSSYFPTPNSFDNLLIELAEAEVRRIYGLAGWEIIQKRAESAIMNLLDSYRSTKNVLAGLQDQQKQVSEKKMMAQENS